MSHFAKGLKELRLERGLTQSALAKELNVTQNAIFNWENEKREPSIEMIQKIANYFSTSLLYLLDGMEDYKKATDIKTNEDIIKENAIKSAPRYIGKLVNGKVPKFTDASTSFEDTLAETEANELERIRTAYKQLNRKGKAKAVERVEELTEIPRYTKTDEPPQE